MPSRRRATTRANPAGLTNRQLEVARLLALPGSRELRERCGLCNALIEVAVAHELAGGFGQAAGQGRVHRERLGQLVHGQPLLDRDQIAVAAPLPVKEPGQHLIGGAALPDAVPRAAEVKLMPDLIDPARDVGLIGAEDKLPGEISGGMRKRAGLARALVLEPEIVLFDEPDSGLDPVRTAFLNQLIVDLNAQIDATFLIVTHDINTARTVPDNIGLLYHRHLAMFGPREMLLSSEEPVVRQFLNALPADGHAPLEPEIRAEALRELRAARKAGLLADAKLELADLAKSAGPLARFRDRFRGPAPDVGSRLGVVTAPPRSESAP